MSCSNTHTDFFSFFFFFGGWWWWWLLIRTNLRVVTWEENATIQHLSVCLFLCGNNCEMLAGKWYPETVLELGSKALKFEISKVCYGLNNYHCPSLVPHPAQSALSHRVLRISMERDSTTSLGNLLQCSQQKSEKKLVVIEGRVLYFTGDCG